MSTVSQYFTLVRRPGAELASEDFEVRERVFEEPGEGQVLVRNRFISVDPYMRRRMNEGPSYVPAFELGAALDGGAVGEVIASGDPAWKPGDWVLHDLGWRDVAMVRTRFARRIDADLAPPSAYLGILGMPGLTAYAGLMRVAGLKGGDTVFVSGAAGAVGSLVGQIAAKLGHRVVGSAGSREKARWLVDDLGFSEAFCYRDGNTTELLSGAAPDGIDVYFDNVGYDHLEAALECANDRARFAMCGTIADYDASSRPAGPSNLFQIVSKRLELRGFIVSDHEDLREEFIARVGGWVADGSLRYRETVRHGLESMPQAMMDLLHGANTGKMVVEI